jgi:hypothetical protein
MHTTGSSKDSSNTNSSTAAATSSHSTSSSACWGGLRTLDTSNTSSSSNSSASTTSSTVQCRPGAALVYQLQPCNSSNTNTSAAALADTLYTGAHPSAPAATVKLSILSIAGLAQADADGLSDAFCTVHWSQPLSDQTLQEPLGSANGGFSEEVTLLRTGTVYVSLDPVWQDETVELDTPSYETVAAGRGDLIIEVSATEPHTLLVC